jgi:class 3 adenylate cyclase/tetratricopeptide (TPR) repeat protein
MVCPDCGHENREGRKFCGNCGRALALLCPACGAANEPGERFCGECGAELGSAAPVLEARPPAPARDAPTAERRLVSVLFADLVGFTALSESRDAEEVRELLSRYFDTCKRLIALYGGTVEKFIGDAVMAVWGTPVATEDDAERAVRAGLDLVAAVSALGDELSLTGLRARAGVLTGEAAVTLGAEGEGMVAGDLVNTASRIQSVAEPGSVFVGEATRRATDQAIAYETAGEHELKGKEGATRVWRALRVVSGRGGELKSEGLEAPFVGRDRELNLIKDLFHASAQNRRAHLVSVTGMAGIGKSRLAWEFYKYFDGIVDVVYWHRGRCLAYGEGVAYWALADMVRMRCRIAEDEGPASARQKLTATLSEHVLDSEERAFVEPRLAHLLGLEDAASGDRQDLFAAWRLFFERLADTYPTVLAFEDMQWADAGLLDFVEYLLEWSRDRPLYVITLARPELHEQRPNWGAGQRNFTSLYLDSLSESAMRELLAGLVPGLPESLTEQILDRAEGVPLYAVETVRMLLDRGLVTEDGPVYRPTGEIETLEVPETLHGLIAARLDGLSIDERRLLQDGAVLGKTFTPRALSAVSGFPEAELQPLLTSLVRKEVLGVQSDARSPERGQYGFLQDLVRHVAYETLSRPERKARHLAAAEHLQTAFSDEDEVAEVLASHYVAAFEAAPDAGDAPEVRAKAGDMLTRAGVRAASLGAPAEGRRYYEQAATLVDGSRLQAELLEAAGKLALRAGLSEDARQLIERAIALHEEAGDRRGAAKATAALADVDVIEGRLEAAAARLEDAVRGLEEAAPTAELATAFAQLGRARALLGQLESAGEPLERALTLAERLQLPEVFVEALTSKSLQLIYHGRLAEARILLEAAAARADAEGLYAAAIRAEINLAVVLEASDSYAEVVERIGPMAARATRQGDRSSATALRVGSLAGLLLLGRWDEALTVAAEEEKDASPGDPAVSELVNVVPILCERGETERASAAFAARALEREVEQPQLKAIRAAAETRLLRDEKRYAEAIELGERTLALLNEVGMTDTSLKRVLVETIEAALESGDLAKADELLRIPESLDPGELTPFLQANAARLRARADAASGLSERVDERFAAAASLFREFDLVFYLAVTQLEHAEWLVSQDETDRAEPLLAEARETFELLRAKPWLDRVDAVRLRTAATPA